MAEATFSSMNQIVIPREAREAAGIKAGDRLSVVVRNNRVIVIQKSSEPFAAIRGSGRGIYPKNYLRKERRSWR